MFRLKLAEDDPVAKKIAQRMNVQLLNAGMQIDALHMSMRDQIEQLTRFCDESESLVSQPDKWKASGWPEKFCCKRTMASDRKHHP